MKDLQAVYADPRLFFRLLKVWDKVSSTFVPFVLNDEQEQLLDALLEHKRVIVLKPRQIGVSTLLRAFAFWMTFCSTTPVRWGTISHTRDSAENLQRMDRGFLDGLPAILTKHRKLTSSKASEIRFGDSGASTSTYTAASKHGTRSYALSDVHISEFAFFEQPEELLATVVGTVGQWGRLVIETTPNVVGDAYHTLVTGALDGSNGWHLESFWWWQHKGYRTSPPDDFQKTSEETRLAERYGLDDEQVYWRRQQVATLGIVKFRREFPASLEDAFAYLEGGYFSESDLQGIRGLRFTTEDMVLQAPRPDDLYVMGVDVGGGVEGDYSVITVVSAATRQVVYTWRNNRVSPAALGDKAALVGGRYGQALILVESNNHGHVTIQRLQDLRYNKLWVGQNGKFWTTTATSKLAAYEALREIVGSGLLTMLPEVTLAELHALRAGTLAPSAPDRQHDDCAVSLALSYYCLRSVPQQKVIQTRQENVDNILSEIRAGKRRASPSSLPWRKAQ